MSMENGWFNVQSVTKVNNWIPTTGTFTRSNSHCHLRVGTFYTIHEGSIQRVIGSVIQNT